MFKNNVTDHKQKMEAIIKNVKTISMELKKMRELSQLLLCDLTLQFNYPMKTEETEGNNAPFEKSEPSDVSLAPNSFSI
ncbi:putative uncharacterized protein C5orf58 homolog [Fukomys damarensis]|uniref:putative uncharacterized protein C5orf58 homolog n=1 Tax=Fukomys damarensis TaxID=885580 RepID=UPI0008FECBC5|nr:putative uncharacterized protein C5orf58 homolog [Fukomys damarensis]XP_019062773.1 putative uncharacterized protein C5orf58 homolog [Fukomys damarensis]XP_019062774.1 putative uncharacterized protein C5orf58 homolog [Fukomys damarensis]XP_019062775.1 putative uncharacterized protein C5orf58 homolog [Fukomys damarensis]XP_019062776.1 putative uncharacterized protein C5orf58 homolog [Fukomys damarensis]XP_019062777.1 putative uncharacterized protein C5orf58 homolog [Fukomys damarensis]